MSGKNCSARMNHENGTGKSVLNRLDRMALRTCLAALFDVISIGILKSFFSVSRVFINPGLTIRTTTPLPFKS
jgi:hypothetical protein